MFEIEFRAKFNLGKYRVVKKYLDHHAKKLGEDDKDCYYYIFSDKLLKLVNNVSKKTAKFSLKLNRLGNGASFPEIEFYFPQNQFETARRLVDNLNLPVKIMHGLQKRLNYSYRGCEVALKHSSDWGYHLEIEKMIKSKNDQKKSEERIRQVAAELNVKLMSEEELKKFIRKVESKL